MKVKSAKNKNGFLLYSPHTERHFFRIYDGEGEFTDYKLSAEDIEIKILDEHIELYEDADNPDENKIDFSRSVLGKVDY